MRESDLNSQCPDRNFFFFYLEESKILKRREGNRSTGACLLYYLFLFLFLFLFFFCVLSYLFLSSLLSYFLSIVFFLSCSSLVFFDPYSGHSGGLFIAPAMTKFYYFAL